MRLKHKDMEGSRRLFEIELLSDVVKKKYQEICDHMRKIAQIPGYRLGKAPDGLLQKFHGDKIKEETIHELISHSYEDALRESSTDTIGAPQISDVEFDLEKGLSFKVKVDIRPKMDLKRYKKMPVERQKIEVKESDVQKYISVLQESSAAFTDVNTRPVMMGDYAVCDVDFFVDGKPICPKRNGVWIYADKKNPVPELAEGLVGLKMGDSKDINARLPDNFEDPKHRNKNAVFKIKVLKIKEKKLPELNDEFAKKAGLETLDDLKKRVREDLTGKLENRIRQDMVDQVISELLKNASFDAPADLVEKETERLVKSKKSQLAKEGGSLTKADEDRFEKESKEQALRRVRLYFALDEIAQREKIAVSDKELDEVMESLAKEYNKTKEELKRYYQEHNLLEGFRDQLKENKVIDFLLDNAEIID